MHKDHKVLFELIIVLILVGFGLWALKKNPVIVPVANDNQIMSPTNGTVNTNTPTALLSYAQALTQYKDARIQLDQNCRASPNNITYKDNTNIMIDNRAAVARVVKVGSVFTVSAYGFKIVRLTSATLPATWYVDCDSSQNVATILIQK